MSWVGGFWKVRKILHVFLKPSLIHLQLKCNIFGLQFILIFDSSVVKNFKRCTTETTMDLAEQIEIQQINICRTSKQRTICDIICIIFQLSMYAMLEISLDGCGVDVRNVSPNNNPRLGLHLWWFSFSYKKPSYFIPWCGGMKVYEIKLHQRFSSLINYLWRWVCIF